MPSRMTKASTSQVTSDPRFDTSKWGKIHRNGASGSGTRTTASNASVKIQGNSAKDEIDDASDSEEQVAEDASAAGVDSELEDGDEEAEEDISDDLDYENSDHEGQGEEGLGQAYSGRSGSTAAKSGDPVVKPLSEKELAAFEEKQKKRGIIYISRIPHGMTVAKVRHLLGGFGDIDRLYLQDGREKEQGQKLTGRRAKSAHFTEGWVEFVDKRVAKAVAEMLNAEPIGAAAGGSGGGKGGKRSGGKGMRRWKDEVWTMKYLGGFKWYMLSEQLANERASRASRVRAELSQSSFEQRDYLRKVERARVMREKEARRKARAEKTASDSVGGTGSTSTARADDAAAKERSFRQREAITRDIREMREKRPHEKQDDPQGKRLKPNSKMLHRDDSRSQALQGALSKIF